MKNKLVKKVHNSISDFFKNVDELYVLLSTPNSVEEDSYTLLNDLMKNNSFMEYNMSQSSLVEYRGKTFKPAAILRLFTKKYSSQKDYERISEEITSGYATYTKESDSYE